jgi:hypothetical protein
MCRLKKKITAKDSTLLFNSVSDPDPHSIGRPDPDPGGLKRAKMKKKRSKKPDN